MLTRFLFGKIYTQILNLLQRKTPVMNSFDKVFVRNVAHEDSIKISFKYLVTPTDANKIREFNFRRPKTEELEKSLHRISGNVSKEVNKILAKRKKSRVNGVNTIHVTENLINVELLDAEEIPIDKAEKNSHAWNVGSLLTVGNTRYYIELNTPSVVSLSIPSVILSGFPILPKLNLEFADLEESQVTWFVYRDEEAADKKKISISIENWTEVRKGFNFVPSKDHIGHHLKISCIPKNGDRIGEEVSFISKDVICEGPLCPFEKRHASTPMIDDPNSFRIMSYNLLADLYADSDFSREVLFPYCPPQYLKIDYRKHLFIKELLGYNADIICLQEVDKKIFTYDLEPMMRNFGLEGVMKLKMGEVAEGCATLYRSSRFRMLESHDMGLVEILQSNHKSMKDLFEKISTNKILLNKVLDRKNILQVSLLQDIENDRFLLVSTTHLFFHPQAAHIRLIQVYLCLHHIQEVIKKLKIEKGVAPSLIFCGDLNASMLTAVHEFLMGGSVLPSHQDWLSGGKEELVSNLHLSHDLQLSNSSGFCQYTNYVKGFNACLDYIYTSGLKCISVVPMPSHEDVIANEALPNQYFPSDHIAVGCNVSWNSDV